MAEALAGGGTLRFEILGPLRAWRGDRELDLGPGKRRALLAVLLVNANKPMGTARLVDAVWGDDPPANGANVVQKHVGGLRRVLEPGRPARAPGQVLVGTDAGYLLRVEPDCLDADRFAGRVRRARMAMAEGGLAAAGEELRAADALWRGEALAGLSGPWFDTVRGRLAEDRAAALETRSLIELELGHHDQAVPELFRLVAEYPLRERLRYLLMLALYRSGRQAEALAAFQDTRRFLAEELGAEPGDQLNQLHLRILRSDPTLLAPGAPAPPTAATAPPPAVNGHAAGEAGAARAAIVTLLTLGPARSRPPAAGRTPAPPTPDGGRRRRWLGGLVAIAIPVASLGLLGWAVITYYAVMRRSWTIGLAAAGYFALTAVFMLGAADAGPAGATPAEMVLLLLLMGGCAAHAAVLGFGRSR